MKKILLPLLLIALLSNSYAQYECHETIETYDFRDGCSRVFPTNIYDIGLLVSSYIPNNSTPIVTIPVNINIWRKMTGQAITGRTRLLSETVCDWFSII